MPGNNAAVQTHPSLRSVLRPKRVSRSFGGDAVIFLFLLLMSAFMVLPLLYVVSNAFKPLDELYLFPPKFFVRHPTTQNFVDLLNLMNNSWVPFSRYVFNTLFVTAVGTAGHVTLASMAAYVLAKHTFWGSKTLFRIVVLSLMFTPAVTQVPNYLTIARLGWIDSLAAVIVPSFSASLGLYLMKQFIELVHDSLLESARIDGAGEFLIFWRIVMPIVKPAWVTLIILQIQSLWSVSSGYIFSEQLKTLSQAILQIVQGGIARAGAASAVGLIMLIVPLTAFIVSQAQIIETMGSSGIKE